MKKIVSVTLLILFVLTANAQVRFGLKGGANYATISNFDEINLVETINNAVDEFKGEGSNEYRFGYNVGAFLSFGTANGRFALQPEFLYSNQGMKNKGTIDFGVEKVDYTSTTELDYVNIPVMLQLYIVRNVLSIEVGPQFGFLVNSKQTVKYDLLGEHFNKNTELNDVNNFDLSYAFGLAFQIPKLPIGVNARYTGSITNVKKGDDKTYNNVLQFGAFLKF